MKGTIKYTLLGIAWGFTWLVIMGVILSLSSEPAFQAMMKNYPLQALGAAAVGVASTLPARIYRLQRLPFMLRFLIHGGIALGVFLPVSYTLGWIPYAPDHPGVIVLEVVIAVGIFLGIWSVFFLINRSEARRINARVRELNGLKEGNGTQKPF